MQIDIPTVGFALVAIFVVWKLRSVLGSRGPLQPPPVDRRMGGGFNPPGPPRGGQVIDLKPAPATAPSPATDRWEGFAAPGSPVAAGFAAIAAVDPSFAPDSFLSGARTAYEMAAAPSPPATCRRCDAYWRPTCSPISTRRSAPAPPPSRR